MKETIEMSRKELDRVGVIGQVAERKLRQREAAERLGLRVRQVKNLVRRYRESGPEGLASRRRGRTPNNAIADAVREEAVRLLRTDYAGLTLTMAGEELEEVHGIRVSRGTLRKWAVEAGLWKPSPRRRPRIHPPRPPRPRLGELEQVDGSPAAWFGSRGAPCTLIIFIDDAASRIMEARFVQAETTRDYAAALRRYLETHGRPLALYSDRHGIFRVNAKGREGERTQFGRMAEELGIELICARTPQAKGRVERCFRTLQDRWIHKLRLLGIDDMETANARLPELIAWHNGKFARRPAREEDAHQPVRHAEAELDLLFAHQELRVLSKNLTFRFRGGLYHVPPRNGSVGYAMRGARITVCAAYSGGVSALYKERVLPVRLLREGERPVPVADEKTLNGIVDRAGRPKPRRRPAADHPWRKYPLRPERAGRRTDASVQARPPGKKDR